VSPEYLAGIIDGEGHIRVAVSCYRYQYARVQVTNTCKPLLDAIQKNFGGKIISHGPRSNPKWSECWKWDTAGQNAIEVLEAVLPFLIVKREDALKALACKPGRIAA
jgi:hypothetical protein